MNKGFVTIATGKNRFYKMAYNLCLSYKLFNGNDIPFAIVCDRENKYTKLFDKVVIIENPLCSFMDKVNLPLYDLFDKNIFIDADSLVYGKINFLFDVFDKENDGKGIVFSCFGLAMPLDYKNSFFEMDGIGEFADKIHFILRMHGGMYFYKKGKQLNGFYSLAKYISDNYNNFSFKYKFPNDETVFSLAMAVSNYRPLELSMKGILIYPGDNNYAKDIILTDLNHPHNCIIHFSSFQTSLSRYKADIYKLNKLKNNKKYHITIFHYLWWKGTHVIKFIKVYLKLFIGKLFTRKR